MKSFHQQLVVLTGATGGIGRALARRLSEQGAQLVLVGRNKERLAQQDASLGIESNGGLCISADLTTSKGRQQLDKAVASLNRSIDALINAAGISCFGTLNQLTDKQIEQAINTNLLSPILTIRTLLPRLNPEGARIANIGSAFGSIGFPGFSVYCASKFALRGFNEALRRELADLPIDMYYIAPRATQTEMNTTEITAMNRELKNTMDEPDRVAEICLNTLLSNRKEYYIGWPERFFIKINQWWPGLVDRALLRQLPIVRRYAQASSTPETKVTL